MTRTVGGFINFQKNATNTAFNPTPENVKKTLIENPAISGAILGGLVLATGGKGSVGAGINAGNTFLNTQSTKENTETLQQVIEQQKVIESEDRIVTTMGSQPIPTGGIPVVNVPASSPVSPSQPLTPQTQVIGREVSSGSRTYMKRKKPVVPAIRNTVRVNVYNRNSYIGRKSYG